MEMRGRKRKGGSKKKEKFNFPTMKNLKLTVRCQQKWQKLKNAVYRLLRKRNPTILKCVPFCEQVELTKNFLNQYHPPWLMRLYQQYVALLVPACCVFPLAKIFSLSSERVIFYPRILPPDNDLLTAFHYNLTCFERTQLRQLWLQKNT